MQSTSSQMFKRGFPAYPRLLKLLIVFILVNAFLIATIPSTRISVFRNVAIIKTINVGVYWDASCSLPVDDQEGIDWGILEPGVEKILALYVRNEGSVELPLTITARDWSPGETSDYITFRSEYESRPVEVGETIPVSLALFISPDIVSSGISSFGFNLVLDTSE